MNNINIIKIIIQRRKNKNGLKYKVTEPPVVYLVLVAAYKADYQIVSFFI